MDKTVLLENKFVDWWAYKCWLICTCNFTVYLTFYISFIITVSKKRYYMYKLGVILKRLHQNNNRWKFAVKALKITNFTVLKISGGWGGLRFKLWNAFQLIIKNCWLNIMKIIDCCLIGWKNLNIMMKCLGKEPKLSWKESWQ